MNIEKDILKIIENDNLTVSKFFFKPYLKYLIAQKNVINDPDLAEKLLDHAKMCKERFFIVSIKKIIDTKVFESLLKKNKKLYKIYADLHEPYHLKGVNEDIYDYCNWLMLDHLPDLKNKNYNEFSIKFTEIVEKEFPANSYTLTNIFNVFNDGDEKTLIDIAKNKNIRWRNSPLVLLASIKNTDVNKIYINTLILLVEKDVQSLDANILKQIYTKHYEALNGYISSSKLNFSLYPVDDEVTFENLYQLFFANVIPNISPDDLERIFKTADISLIIDWMKTFHSIFFTGQYGYENSYNFHEGLAQSMRNTIVKHKNSKWAKYMLSNHNNFGHCCILLSVIDDKEVNSEVFNGYLSMTQNPEFFLYPNTSFSLDVSEGLIKHIEKCVYKEGYDSYHFNQLEDPFNLIYLHPNSLNLIENSLKKIEVKNKLSENELSFISMLNTIKFILEVKSNKF